MSAKVSVGMPVYNGENYLARAIESILDQTFKDFELIICDNHSTDGTQGICEHHARKDPRIRYVRHPKNLGAAANFNSTFHLATAPYFKWAAHDDDMAPTFLEKTVAALDARPDAVLAHPITEMRDPQGRCLEIYDHTSFGTAKPSRIARLEARLRALRCFEIFGLMRREALATTDLLEPHVAHDRTLLIELALKGPFAGVPEVLFVNQDHEARFTRTFKGAQAQLNWYKTDQTKSRRNAWRNWTIYGKALSAIRRNVPAGERVACYAVLGRSIFWQKRWRGLLREPVVAVMPGIAGLPSRLRLRG